MDVNRVNICHVITHSTRKTSAITISTLGDARIDLLIPSFRVIAHPDAFTVAVADPCRRGSQIAVSSRIFHHEVYLLEKSMNSPPNTDCHPKHQNKSAGEARLEKIIQSIAPWLQALKAAHHTSQPTPGPPWSANL